MTFTTTRFASALAAVVLMSGLWFQAVAPVTGAPIAAAHAVTIQTQLA